MIPVLRLGAFDVALDCASSHRELLEALFRVRAEPMPAGTPVDLRLTLGAAGERWGFGQGVALRCAEEGGGRVRFASDVVAGHLDADRTPGELRLGVDESNPHVRHLDLYLRIVLAAVLRRLGRLRLHAAAIALDGSAAMFVGEKATGKTTISLHLAREGGTVLGEDQIMVRRSDGGTYVVAGGDDLMRVTAKTEAHFFLERLPGALVDVAGIPKKEIRAREHIAYVPNGEYRLRRLFFPGIGERFAIAPMPRVEAVRRLAAPLLPINRFTGDDDRRGFLDFLAGIARQAECFSLTLTPDLGDLRQLSRFLA